MNRIRMLVLSVVLLALGAPLRVAAEESSLTWIPAKAVKVMQIRGPRARDHLLTMAAKAGAELEANLRPQADKFLDEYTHGAELKGLAKEGPIFLVSLKFSTPQQPGPRPALLARVTDYAAFRDSFLSDEGKKSIRRTSAGVEIAKSKTNQDLYFLQRRSHAVLAEDEETATAFVRFRETLEGKLSKELREGLLGPDLAFYFDIVEINQVYGNDIRTIRTTAMQYLTAAKAINVIPRGLGKGLETMAGNLFDAIADSRALLVSFDFRPEGLLFHAEASFSESGPTEKWLKGWTLSPISLLARLPGGRFGYTAGTNARFIWDPFAQGARRLGMIIPGETPKGLAEASAELEAAGAQDGASAAGDGEVNGNGAINIYHYRNVNKAALAQLKMFQSLRGGGHLGALYLKKAEVVEEREKHRGFTLHYVEWSVDVAKSAQLIGLGRAHTAEILKMASAGEYRMWFGTDGKVLLWILAKDWVAARRVLDGYIDGGAKLGLDKSFQLARRQFPTQLSGLMLMDMPETFYIVAKGLYDMRKVVPLKVREPAPLIKGERVYAGFGFTLQSQRAAVDAWVPAAGVEPVRKILMSVAPPP